MASLERPAKAAPGVVLPLLQAAKVKSTALSVTDAVQVGPPIPFILRFVKNSGKNFLEGKSMTPIKEDIVLLRYFRQLPHLEPCPLDVFYLQVLSTSPR